MSHAQIEEVSDSDLGSDPSEGDIDDLDDDFDEREILKARTPASAPKPTLTAAKASLINPSAVPSSSKIPFPSHVAADGTRFQSTTDESKYKDFQCIYPVYFDKSRSRAEGRRVGIAMAVVNPLAREIVNACGILRLETLFEPMKIHPKDWANPGRVRVRVKGGNNPAVKNKHHLYTLISKHLLAHPTTIESAKSVQMPGLPPLDSSKPYPTPAIPKGWKMGTLLPSYSPGLSGGGVSENFFKDMMSEMQQGGGPPGMPDMSMLANMMGGAGGAGPSSPAGGGESSKKKKEKKKIIRA